MATYLGAMLGRAGVTRSWLNWGNRGIFALLDQGLFAGANLSVSVLLARSLRPELFGAFTLAYSGFLLLGAFYLEILATPMLVFGATKDLTDFRRYLGVLLRAHIGISAALGLILIVAAAIVWRSGSTQMATVLVGFGLAAPCILLLWLVRYAFYASFRPQVAAVGGGVYLLILTGGIFGLYRVHHLTSVSALTTIGLASLSVSTLLLLFLRPEWPRLSTCRDGHRSAPGPEADGRSGIHLSSTKTTILRDHFQYAKWSLPSSGVGWLSSYLPYFVLSTASGLGVVAALRVLETVLVPYRHYQTAIAKLVVSFLGVRARSRQDDLFSYVVRIGVFWAVQAVLVYVVVASFAPGILSLLYGARYVQYSHLLGLYALVLVPDGAGDMICCLFRAVVRTDLVFWYQLLFAACLLVALLIVASHGLVGVILARVLLSFAVLPIEVVSARAVCSALKTV